MTTNTATPSRSLVDLLGESRAQVVRHLRDHGATTVHELADHLGVSDVATRRHVDRLAEDGLIASELDRTGRGRPAHRWSLTPAGRELFPQRYADLAEELLDFLTGEGYEELGAFLRWRQQRQAERLAAAVDADDMPGRLQQLVAALNDSGFRAEVAVDGDGWTITQTHCAIERLAVDEPLLCRHEAAAFSRVLGDDVRVTRDRTLADGDAACVSRITRYDPPEHTLPVISIDHPTHSCPDGPPSVTNRTRIPSEDHL